MCGENPRLFRVQPVDPPFDGDFAVGGEAVAAMQHVQNRRHLLPRQVARRSAAEVDRVDRKPPGLFRPAFQFALQQPEVLFDLARPGRSEIERAERAAAPAERDVDIKRSRRKRIRHQCLAPRFRRILHRFGEEPHHAARGRC
ncbi:hypothetical protein SDC9_204218 [bioreactor metagenome]|uniref:Uncharacterized protein n=1 Tax=bioreactor metagenome TaxID=1076179 RepID=A0A645IYN7_9ZZZZ